MGTKAKKENTTAPAQAEETAKTEAIVETTAPAQAEETDQDQDEISDVRTEKDHFAKLPLATFDSLVSYFKKHASHWEKKEILEELENVTYQQR